MNSGKYRVPFRQYEAQVLTPQGSLHNLGARQTWRLALSSASPIEGPFAPLSEELPEVLKEHRRTIYRIRNDTGINGACIWRIVRGEPMEVSRNVEQGLRKGSSAERIPDFPAVRAPS